MRAGTSVAAPTASASGTLERVQPANGLDQRQGAAGEHAVGAARDAVPNLDVDVAEPVAPVADSGGRDRVRDERDTAGGRAPHDPCSLLGEVMAVEDHLDDHVVARKRGPGDTRVSVPERPHRVEEVRHCRHAAVEGTGSFLGRCVGVPARDDDSACVQAGR